jgi:hypothetical protein
MRGDRGHAAVELALAVGLLLLPVAIAVLGFGPWMERRVFAEAAASESARAAVLDLNTSTGTLVVGQMAADHALGPDLVRVGWCGAEPRALPLASGSCVFERGGTVDVEVRVWVPVVSTPWGEIGGVWVGSVHREQIDLYRSLP